MVKLIKLLALTGLICMASSAQASDVLPAGTFQGTGHWTGPEGSAGEYDVTTVIEGNQITSTYNYPGAQPGRDRHTVQLTRQDDGTIAVVDETGTMTGNGYCLGDGCFYRMQVEGITIEENIRVTDGWLIKFGSKTGPGFRVVWKERLELD